MKKFILAAAAAAAMAMPAPAQAALTLVGKFTGNDCQGVPGGFDNCFASSLGTNNANGENKSFVVVKFNGTQEDGAFDPFDVTEVSDDFASITGGEFTFEIDGDFLDFTYNPGAGDPILHYISIKQGRSYALFYDSAPILGGSIDLDALGYNAISHITLFNSQGPAVPEPATWALLILGFGGVGGAMRSARKRRPVLNYI